MKLKVVILTLALLLMSSCCDTQMVSGTGKFPCETCPDVPINLVCTKNAVSLAQQDASSKAKAECTKSGRTLKNDQGTDWKEGTAECIKQGNQWYVQIQVTGTFECCK